MFEAMLLATNKVRTQSWKARLKPLSLAFLEARSLSSGYCSVKIDVTSWACSIDEHRIFYGKLIVELGIGPDVPSSKKFEKLPC